MKRLFITLYIFILVAVFGLVFTLNPALELGLAGTISNYNYKTFKGTVYLLDQYILEYKQSHTSDDDNYQKPINQLNNFFAYNVNLLPLENTELNKKQKRLLKKYNAVEIDNDDNVDEYLYIPSRVIQDHIWRLQTSPTQKQVDHDLVIGSALLIEKELEHFPESQWQQQIQQLEQHFGIPLEIIDSNHKDFLSLPDDQKLKLNQYQVIGIDVNSSKERYFYRFQNSNKILNAGPITEPAITNYLLLIICIFVFIFFALVIYLWVRPLWVNLSELKKASSSFGEGKFDTRAKITKLSPISPISQSFNSMAERVQSLISSHKELTNAVSHELRTPLARMRFSLEMLDATKDDKKRTRYSNEIATDIEELDALINELLTYARFERSQPELETTETDIIPWLEAQVSRAKKLTNTLDINLHFPNITSKISYVFENRLLARALSNLLQNSIRYAVKRIDVTLIQNNESFSITVEDDGPGIPEEKRESIFDPFNRADSSRTRDTGGFGIGLAIVNQVAQWHQGTVFVSSSALGGACFTLTIPQEKNLNKLLHF
jgi:signal transduction histidine kinase